MLKHFSWHQIYVFVILLKKNRQSEVQLREQGVTQRKELETWRRNTEKVTAGLAWKDQEIESLQVQQQNIEAEVRIFL